MLQPSKKLWKDGKLIEEISKGLMPENPPTNLWKFGIPKEETHLHNERYYVSALYLSKFLDTDYSGIKSMAKTIIRTHKLIFDNEMAQLNKKAFKKTYFMSEELVYLLIMARYKQEKSVKLRLMFTKILWSSDHSMTLPFPENDLANINDKINSLKTSLDFLTSEIQKSIQYSQRTIVE